MTLSVSVRPLLAAACLCGAFTASAQFSPYGSTTINTTTNTAQTLTSGTGTITSTGAISVSSTSVSLTLSGTNTTLLNYGTIANTNAGASGNPRALVADGTNIQITNEVGGVIQAAGNDAVRSSNAGTSITFTNYGTITASNTTTTNPQQAVDWNSITTGANTFYNYGTVQATGNDAIRPGVNGVIYNHAGGLIKSTNNTSGTSSDGIDAQANSGVQINNSGTIEGGRHGITGGNTSGNGAYTMSITNNANATIQADNGAGVNIDGINGNETVTILNNGTITGNGSTVNSGTTQDGDAVDVDGLVNLTNNGTIRSVNAIGDTSEGVTVGGGTITNNAGALIEGDVASGNTSGAVGRGITLAGIDTGGPQTPIYANSTINNYGTIRGQSDSGIAVGGGASGFTVTINNYAGGLIEGGGATAAVIQTSGDNDTINNYGSIVADQSNLAIDMGAGNNTLNILGGSASITGNVSGGTGGTNALFITPGAGSNFTYGGSFSNFATAQIGAGRVTLSGASTYGGTTTVLNGATLVANTAAATGSATGTSTVNVQNGGILAGTGNVAGLVTLAAGANISPGDNGVGNLTLGSDLDTVGGSSFTFDIGQDGLRSDRLTLGGTLAFTGSGQMTFNIVSNNISTGTFDLIDFTGHTGFDLSNLAFGSVPSGFQGSFVLTGTELAINITAVPEPGTDLWIAATMAIVALGVARRRAVRSSHP